MKRLLLISSSVSHGSGYLDHCETAIRDLLGPGGQLGGPVLFVPYALFDRDGYAAKAADRFARMGYELISIHRAAEPALAVATAAAVFVGGGNTFRLLRDLRAQGLLQRLRDRILAGLPYLGTSAGTNVACPTIRTTNDMPIVDPGGFDALGAVPFQINPHYLDPDPASTHHGETREQRLREYLEENDQPVVGLREGGMLWVEGESVRLLGRAGARVFRRHAEPEEQLPGADLSDLMVP